MKCIIPNQNVKIIARAVHSLSKIGDEMFIEPMKEEIAFRTVNMAQSAFAEFKINQSFFSSYSFSEPEDNDCLCKVTMRSCLNVFKNLHSMDKQVENCEIRMKTDGSVVIFQMKYTNAPVKKYYLPIIESEKLEANIPTDTINRLTASSKMLMSTIKNFRYSEDEITISVEKDKTCIKNHIEVKKDMHSMRTELSFHPSEFENYLVSNPACITFCFKELRAVLAFAEPSSLSVSMSFSSPGMPIVFQVPNFPIYEANYVVSTLNSNSSNLEMNLTRHSRALNQQPLIAENLYLSQEQRDPYRFIDGTESYNIQQNSVIEESLPETNVANTSSSRIQNRQNIIDDNVKQSVSVHKGIKRKKSDLNNTSLLNDEIESIYSTFDTSTFLRKSSSLNIEKTNSPSHSSHLINIDNSLELIKLVFTRCFRKINLLEKIPGNEIVIAEQSDCESV